MSWIDYNESEIAEAEFQFSEEEFNKLKSQLDKAQSDLEREQKCVELAVEALDKLLKKVRQYAEAGCIEAMNPDRDYENGLGAEEDRAIEALTKIKSLREGEIK